MKKNNKGFTLMEMLIVVAIIAVLVAIAIPTFTASLNKARVATDEANIRSGYASTMLEILTSDKEVEDGTTYGLNADGSVAAKTAGSYTTKGDATRVGTKISVGGHDIDAWGSGETVTYTYHAATAGGQDSVTISTAGK